MRIAACALVLLACAAPIEPVDLEVSTSFTLRQPEVTTTLSWRIVIDPDVPPWRTEVVFLALEDWQRVVPCPIGFEVVRAQTQAVDYMSDAPVPLPPQAFTIEIRMVNALPNESTGWAEWFTEAGSRIAFRETDNESDFRRVARHELGHGFGLPHDDVNPSLMRSVDCNHSEIMPADVAAFGAMWCVER